MNTVERIKEECKNKRVPISKLEKELGFSNGYIAGLRKGNVPADRLEKIAKYLKVSDFYLLTGYEPPENQVVYASEEEMIEAQANYHYDTHPNEILLGNDDLRLLFETVKNAPSDVLVRLRYYAEGLMAGRKDQT